MMRNGIEPLSLRWSADPAAIGTRRSRGRRPAYSARDMLAIAWHGKWLWIALGLVGLAIGAVVMLAVQPGYEARALVLSVDADDGAVQSDLSIARSDGVMQAIAARIGADAFARSHFSAQPDGDRGTGRVLRLTASAATPTTAVAMLDAAVSAIRDTRQAAYVTARAAILAPQLAEAQRDVAVTAADIAELRSRAGVLDIATDIAAASDAAASLARRDSEIRERQAAVQTALVTSRSLLADMPEQVSFSREQSSRDAGEESRSTLLRLRLERAHMAQAYAPDYPGLVELDRKIEITARPQPRSLGSVTQERRNPTYDGLAEKIAALQVEGESLVVQHDELARQSGDTAARISALGAAATSLAALQQQQDLQQQVASKLTIDIAQLRSQDSLARAQGDGLRLLQPPVAASTEFWPHRADLPAGLAVGLLAGFAATIAAARRRDFYVVGREAERDLDATQIGDVALWRRGAPLELSGLARNDLAQRILDATNAEGAPITTVHLIATADHDGTELIARAIADGLAASRRARVLVMHLHRDGRGEIQSLSLDAPAAPRPPGQSLSVTMPANTPAASAAQVVCALFGDATSVDGRLQDQVARLRAIHDVIVVVSAHGTAPAVTRRLSALADRDILVVRAQHSQAATVARLRHLAIALDGRAPGFVFTRDRGPLSGNSARCA